MREPTVRSLLRHTAFLDSQLRLERRDGVKADQFLHFLLGLGVVDLHHKTVGLLGLSLFDHEYPARPIYSETVEIRVGVPDAQQPRTRVQFRWLSEANVGPEGGWQDVVPQDGGVMTIPLREAPSFAAKLRIDPDRWPDAGCEDD